MEKKINLIVKESVKNVRVDIFISNNEIDISRSRIKNLILDKKLKINNKTITDPAKKISDGDHIVLKIPEPKKASLNLFRFVEQTGHWINPIFEHIYEYGYQQEMLGY